MPPALPACIVCCLLEESVCAPQGAKRPPGGTTGKKWNRGAPLSKKAKAKGDSDSQPAPTGAEQQDPLAQAKLATVLLTAALKDINNSRMQAFFATGAPHDCMTS